MGTYCLGASGDGSYGVFLKEHFERNVSSGSFALANVRSVPEETLRIIFSAMRGLQAGLLGLDLTFLTTLCQVSGR